MAGSAIEADHRDTYLVRGLIRPFDVSRIVGAGRRDVHPVAFSDIDPVAVRAHGHARVCAWCRARSEKTDSHRYVIYRHVTLSGWPGRARVHVALCSCRRVQCAPRSDYPHRIRYSRPLTLAADPLVFVSSRRPAGSPRLGLLEP